MGETVKAPAWIVVSFIAVSTLALVLLVVALVPQQLGADRFPDPVTHQLEQSDDVTCAACAYASAESWCGRQITERQAVVACKTHSTGTAMEDIAAAAHSHKQTLPASAPGHTYVVEIDDTKPHAVCAHGELNGWTVNQPDHKEPEHWTTRDFANADVAVEVKP